MQQTSSCSKCYVDTTLGVIGGKWKLVILWYLRQSILRFSQLQKLIPQVSQKMLTQQLRELEKDGLIKRRVYPQVPPKVEYSITKHGKSLEDVLQTMSTWGETHQHHTQQ